MPDHQLDLDGYSIVVLGSFNPAIFQPFWFSEYSLIRKEEADNAKIQVIHRNVTVFSTEWFTLQVTESVFSIETRDPTKALPLRDLAISTFKILEHTPLKAFGLNRFQHFKMDSIENWNHFGHHYAPKESWNGILEEPGLRTLIIQGKFDEMKGTTEIKIEPSASVPNGVFIGVNEHHNLKEESSAEERNKSYLTKLNSRWDDYITYTNKLADHLFAESAHSGGSHKKKKKG